MHLSQRFRRNVVLHCGLFGTVVSGVNAQAQSQSSSQALTPDTFSTSVGYALQSDDNLFRLPASAQPRSERIDAILAALSIDKSYSLQRFTLTGSVIDYHYRNFGYLSFNAFNYNAAWQWSLTPGIRGTLSTDRNQVLNSFSDFRSYGQRNVRTDRTTRFDAEADLGAAVKVLGGLDMVRRSDELSGVIDGDREAQGASIAIRYVFPNASTISYRFRKGDGESNNGQGPVSSLLPGHFDEQLHELQTSWAITGKTMLNGSIGHVSRSYPDLASRDFSGPVADVNVQWDITGKTRISAALRRELVNYQSDISTYVATDRFIIKPLWKATSHIDVFGNFEIARRNFGGSVLTTAFANGRRDNYSLLSLGLEWKPIDAATITFNFQRMKNTSNYNGFDFVSNGASVAGRFAF